MSAIAKAALNRVPTVSELERELHRNRVAHSIIRDLLRASRKIEANRDTLPPEITGLIEEGPAHVR